jgi:hypothetical protein
MNKKNLRILKYWNKGIRDPRIIAQKLGYLFDMEEGIERVTEGLYALGLIENVDEKTL